jgi:hypothetical protein
MASFMSTTANAMPTAALMLCVS